MKRLVILRGVPGSGKTTLAHQIANGTGVVCEADQFFTCSKGYRFIPHLLETAHEWCRRKAAEAMKNGMPTVVIANTNLMRRWFEPYLLLAEQYDYSVQEVVLFSRFKNVHGVPDEKVNRMAAVFHDELVNELFERTK